MYELWHFSAFVVILPCNKLPQNSLTYSNKYLFLVHWPMNQLKPLLEWASQPSIHILLAKANHVTKPSTKK